MNIWKPYTPSFDENKMNAIVQKLTSDDSIVREPEVHSRPLVGAGEISPEPAANPVVQDVPTELEMDWSAPTPTPASSPLIDETPVDREVPVIEEEVTEKKRALPRP